MLALEQWAEGKFKPIAMFAQTVAMGAEECYGLVQQLRDRKLFNIVPCDANRKRFRQLFRQPLAVEAASTLFFLAPNCASEIESFGKEWDGWHAFLGESLKAVDWNSAMNSPSQSEHSREKLERFVERQYRKNYVPHLERLIRQEPIFPANMEAWSRRPELLFLLTTAVPCWLLFQVTPWQLYQEARRGSILSLEKLLRLCPDMEADACIAHELAKLRKKSPRDYQQLKTASADGLDSIGTVQDMKFLFGGLIMKWSHELEDMLRGELLIRVCEEKLPPWQLEALQPWLNQIRRNSERTSLRCWIKANDIKELYNAIAQDTRGELADGDFCQQPNSIYKRLSRNAELWPSLWKTDKLRVA